ncbi:MAG: S8 family serine peptidase [Planctomycetes bacterium]|nr:S8 family serine peptidase [Planctomycetota bacterium]
MILSRIWSWAFARAPKAPARRKPSPACLAVEVLEDRVVPSTAATSLYQQWRQQSFRVDDVRVANYVPTPSNQSTTPSNASFGSLIGLPIAFTNTTYRGTGYSVAIIDTGIDYNNPNLGGGFGAGHRVVAGWDFANNDADPMDDNGHGTHVAGIIGSSNAAYSGVAPDVNLIALKVLGKDGSGTFGDVEKALQWVAANRTKYNIVAVNMSLGAGNYTVNPYTFLEDEFTSLKSGGVFISVAAGNSFYTYKSAAGLDYPAISTQVVSVGAVYAGDFGAVAWASGARDNTTAADRVASFSQRGPALTILAPGAMINSTYLNNTFKLMAGTSMASPVVAGASVLIHQAMDAMKLTANQDTIVALMKKTGVNVVDGDDENDNVNNTGLTFKRLDVGAALASLGKAGNSAPSVSPIVNQTIALGGAVRLTLQGSDADGDPITWSASVISSSGAQAYQLKQQYAFKYLGNYYTNIWGQNEKWLSSTSGTWYCLLPSGQLRKWTGSMSTTMQPAALIATLEGRFYADPALLWNAQAPVNLTLSWSGNQLTMQAPVGVAGSYQIQVVASDGKASSTQTFTVSVAQNTAPQIGTLTASTVYAHQTQTITLTGSDAQNDPITWNARIIGTYASAPASLVLVGNRLTIHAAADFVGGFDVQVTAADGSAASNATFRVNALASPAAWRVAGDFNGDKIQDTAFVNPDGAIWVSLKRADGSVVNQNWGVWANPASWTLFQAGDFNGDGKADLIGFNAGGSWSVGVSNGSSFTTTAYAFWGPASYWRKLAIGDFNNDGKIDIVGVHTNGWIFTGLSTGSSFDTKLWAQLDPAATWTSMSFGDVDGDGKADFLGQRADGAWYVAYSTGSSFTLQLWTGASPPVAKGARS